MTIPKDNTQLENARRLRREMTPHERKLWYLFLRKHPVKIYKQRIEGYKTLSVTCGDSSPKGRAKGLRPLHSMLHEKWSVSVSIRSIDCFMNTHLRPSKFFA